ncbi:MAG: ABC transporter permease [Anaerolineae bacterium]|nr:ABC transporter permease [Anaerolineae bacterium]
MAASCDSDPLSEDSVTVTIDPSHAIADRTVIATTEAQPTEPAHRAVTVIEPSRGLVALRLGEVWEYRELLYFLAWRDVKVRYKQTALGILWIILQPVVSIVIFSLLFGGLLKVPSGDVPYPLFALAALIPWNYFTGSLTRASQSLVQSANLITKVYFPRLIIPVSGVIGGLVDFAVSMLVLAALLVYYRVPLTPTVLMLPFFLLLAMLTALGFGLWLSALNVRYRDVGYLVPFLLQMWMYVTPVVYSASLVPEQYRFILALNPMTAVVEGFRWSLLGSAMSVSQATPVVFVISLVMLAAVVGSGLVFFRRTERTFADVV